MHWSTAIPALSLMLAYAWGRYVGRQSAPTKWPPLNFAVAIDSDPIGGFRIADVAVTANWAADNIEHDPPGRED